MGIVGLLGERQSISGFDIRIVKERLSASSPFKENLAESMKLLGLVDERMWPLPVLTGLWQQVVPGADAKPVPLPKLPALAPEGRVATLMRVKGYGFIRDSGGKDHFFHVSDLVDAGNWPELHVGSRVMFELGVQQIPGKGAPARNVRLA